MIIVTTAVVDVNIKKIEDVDMEINIMNLVENINLVAINNAIEDVNVKDLVN